MTSQDVKRKAGRTRLGPPRPFGRSPLQERVLLPQYLFMECFMLARSCRCIALLASFCLLASLFPPDLVADSDTENPPTLAAADLLPKAVLLGPDHSVDDVVQNDGFMNIYTLHSPKGDLRVESTALLYARIHELQAAAAMDQVNAGAAFGKSMAVAGENTVMGAVNLVIHPIDTLSGAASGVGKTFSRISASNREHRPPDDKGQGAELLGYNQAYRDYAKTFGVDPYSRNPILQASLKRLVGAGFAGDLTIMAAKAVAPGGMLLTVLTSGGSVVKDIDVRLPPEDLFMRNRTSLQAMGVPPDVVDLFIDNPHFLPTVQSRLVAALDSLPQVKDRALCVRSCVLTDNDDVAYFRERLFELYANINATIDPLDRFVGAGKLVAARTVAGGFLVAYPLDYLAWTPAMVSLTKTLDEAAEALNASSKKCIVSGEVSPMAASRLRADGWTVTCLLEGLVPQLRLQGRTH